MSVASITADVYDDVVRQLAGITGALAEGEQFKDTRPDSSVVKDVLDMRSAELDGINEINTSEDGLMEDARKLAVHQRNQRLRRDVLIARQGHKRLMQGAVMIALQREKQLEDMINDERRADNS